MGLKDCTIIFDNPYNTYYAGQTVNGRVDLTLDSPKKIRGITIKFKGEANTSWTDSESITDNEGKSQTETIYLLGHEEYFHIEYNLVGSKAGEMELPAGAHSYPFTCALPPALPSSFEGDFGHVRYTVKVTLDRPWKFDQDTKVAFTVVSPVDLNLNPRVKEPDFREMEKHFCCCCCKSGPLTVNISIPMTGFVPGQHIPIQASLDNASNVDVEQVEFTLRKVVTFYSQTPKRESKHSAHTIATLSVGPINATENKTFNQHIEVPSLPPSNLTNCGVIDLDYELKVNVKVPGVHKGMETKIPITLGTIPLVSVNQVGTDIPQGPPAGGINIGWNTVGGGDAPIFNSPYPTIPPPTYTESQFGTKSIQDAHDNDHTKYSQGAASYAPRYPVYNFTPSAPTMQ